MMRAGILSATIVSATPLVAGCSGEKPTWADAEGWVAARCEASAQVLVNAGEDDMQAAFEEWRGLTDPFSGGLTDSSMELRQNARTAMWAILDGHAKARTFFDKNCGPDDFARIRRAI